MQPRLGATCNSRRLQDVYPRNTGDLDLTNGPRTSCDSSCTDTDGCIPPMSATAPPAPPNQSCRPPLLTPLSKYSLFPPATFLLFRYSSIPFHSVEYSVTWIDTMTSSFKFSSFLFFFFCWNSYLSQSRFVSSVFRRYYYEIINFFCTLFTRVLSLAVITQPTDNSIPR